MGPLYLKNGTVTATEERRYRTVIMGRSLEPHVLGKLGLCLCKWVGKNPNHRCSSFARYQELPDIRP